MRYFSEKMYYLFVLSMYGLCRISFEVTRVQGPVHSNAKIIISKKIYYIMII